MVVPSDHRPVTDPFPAAARVSKSSPALHPKGSSDPRLMLTVYSLIGLPPAAVTVTVTTLWPSLRPTWWPSATLSASVPL